MALLASQVIQAARDAHPAFSPGRVAPPVAWRALLRIYQQLISQVARISPDVLTPTVVTAALPLASHSAGIALGTGILQPLDTTAFDTAGNPTAVELVAYNVGATAIRHPAATLLGTTAFLLGEATWWTAWASVRVRFIAQPALALTDATTLALPDDALPALSARLAAVMATRLAENGQPLVANAGQLASDARDAEMAFLERVGAWKRPQTLRIREVF